jgi:hypothetical protein
MGVSRGDDHKYVVMFLTNYHFQMENNKISEVGHVFELHLKHFLVD